jgi:hypothetical protein
MPVSEAENGSFAMWMRMSPSAGHEPNMKLHVVTTSSTCIYRSTHSISAGRDRMSSRDSPCMIEQHLSGFSMRIWSAQASGEFTSSKKANLSSVFGVLLVVTRFVHMHIVKMTFEVKHVVRTITASTRLPVSLEMVL